MGQASTSGVPVPLDPSWLGYPKHTTPSSNESSGWVTITHPGHPLIGQRVAVVRIRRRTGDSDVIIQMPDGSHAAVAMSWTNYGLAPGVPAENSVDLNAVPMLDPIGLCQMAEFIGRVCANRVST